MHILLAAWYSDTSLVAWAGVVANLAVVGVALFLNLLLESLRRPRFQVACQGMHPWQVVLKADEAENIQLLYVRLQVQNVGRTYEEACEVRVEQVFRLSSEKEETPEPIEAFTPRPLRWIERDTSFVILSAGASDFVDLGVRRSDSLELLRLDFGARGNVDLWASDKATVGFRITGAAYGKQARPKSFTFDLSWNPLDFGPTRVEKV